MDDDLYCKPKRTVGRRDLFGLPYGLQVDKAFAISVNVPVPTKDSLQEEPWQSPTFQQPDHRAESQAKGLMQNEMARDLAQSVHDKNQVLLTGASKVVQPQEQFQEHVSLVKDEVNIPKFMQKKLARLQK